MVFVDIWCWYSSKAALAPWTRCLYRKNPLWEEQVFTVLDSGQGFHYWGRPPTSQKFAQPSPPFPPANILPGNFSNVSIYCRYKIRVMRLFYSHVSFPYINNYSNIITFWMCLEGRNPKILDPVFWCIWKGKRCKCCNTGFTLLSMLSLICFLIFGNLK